MKLAASISLVLLPQQPCDTVTQYSAIMPAELFENTNPHPMGAGPRSHQIRDRERVIINKTFGRHDWRLDSHEKALDDE